MDNSEIWLDIKGYEGSYQVSSLGRVKSLARVIEYRKGIYGNKKEIILKTFKDRKGYLKYKLCKNGKEKSVISHRLVALAFLHNLNQKPEVNHINGIKDDNRLENLEWCTSSENTIHALNEKLKIPQKFL